MKQLAMICLLLPLFVIESKAGTEKLAWKLRLSMGDHLFPSFIVATASMPPPKSESPNANFLGDAHGLLGAEIATSSANTHIRLEINIPQLYAAGAYEGNLPTAGQTYEIFPKIQYRYDLLLRQRQLVPATATFKLFVNGKFFGQGSHVLQVHSINDCPRSYIDEAGKAHNIRWMYAAYVNEDHPWIDALLREALNTKVVNDFRGYMHSKPEDVYKQVFAIWDIFQRRGFKYSTISVNATTGVKGRVANQHVRFLDESIKTSEANCVDGSALFASVLRKIEIDPILILIPGHCFLGFYLDQQHKQVAFLETTMMGLTDLKSYPENTTAHTVANSVGENTRNQVSFKAFLKALQVGDQEFKKNESALGKKDSLDYMIVDIGQARKMGVMPLAR